MKLLFILILIIAAIGCGETAKSVVPIEERQKQAYDSLHFREGMEHGAIFSSVIVGRALCVELKVTRDQCTELETQMSTLAITKIRNIPEETIASFARQDSSFKGAMKEGATLFAVVVGQVLCDSLRASKVKCVELRTIMKKTADEMINRLSDEDIKRIRANPKSDQIFV